VNLRIPLWLLGGLFVLAETASARAQSPPTKVPPGTADGGVAPIDQRAGNSSVGDAKTREPIEIRTGHPSSIYALAFSPDRNEMATTCGRGDPRVRFWDPRTGRFLRSLEAHAAGAWAVAYTPDGKRLVTSSISDQEDVCVWDAQTHRKLLGLKCHKHGAGLVAVSTDGKCLLSMDNLSSVIKAEVAMWDLETGKLLGRHPTQANVVERAVLLPDGRTLLLVDRQRVRLLDAGTLTIGGDGDLGYVEAPDVGARKPDSWLFAGPTIGLGGRMFATGEVHKATELRETLSGRTVWQIHSGIHSGRSTLAPNGRTIAQPSWGARIELLDVPSERTILTLGPLLLPVYKLAFSPDGQRLAAVSSGSKATTIYLWDLTDIASRPLPKPKVGPKDVDRWCTDLAGQDARAAYRAVWSLAGAPEQALPRLRAMIHERLRMTPADMDRWIAGLDGDRFSARETAAARLRWAGTAAVPQMEAALKNGPSAEQRRRLQVIIAAIREAPVPTDRLFAARAHLVLEQIGTPETQSLLDEWASRDPGVRREAETRALVERLTKLRKPDE
jgi:WD40 repeat protein